MPALWQKLVETRAEGKRQIDATLSEAEKHEEGLDFKAEGADLNLRDTLKQLNEKDAKLAKDIEEARAAASIDLNYEPIQNAAGDTDEQKRAKEQADIEAQAKAERTKAGDFPTPFAHIGDQLAAIASAALHPELGIDAGLLEIQAATGASEGVGSEGGFLVQTDFQAELMRLTHETGVLVGLCDNTTVGANSNGLKINAVDEASRVDGSRQGGIQAYWTAEAGALTKSKPTYRQMELTLQKLTGLYYATDELLMDKQALGQEISGAFSEEFGFKLDDAIVRGSGAGQPLGILGHAGTVSVAKETGQPATTIVKENIEKMYSRMWAPSVARSTWFINQDCWPQLFQLSQIVGVGGVPVFLPPGGISAAPFGTLLGRPVQPIEQCETLGTVGDIFLADLTQYKTIDKGSLEAAQSMHVQFTTDEMTFRFILRFDGQPKRNAPLTPYKGTNTQSSFVTLNTRA